MVNWGLPAADVVELQGGDRLTGSALKVAKGKLHFQTAHAETPLQIEWASVTQLILEKPRDLHEAELAPEKKGWLGRAREASSLSADFGQSYSGLSKYNQLSANAEVEYEGGRWDGSFVMHYNYYGGTEDARSSYQTYGRLIAQRYLKGDHLFAFPYAFLGRQTEANGAAGQLRQYGGGLGWTFHRHRPDQVSLLTGVVRSRGDGFAMHNEVRSDLSVDDLLAVGGVSWDKTLPNKVELSLRLYYFKPLRVTGHHAMATDASAKIPLYGPAYFTVRAYDTPELRQKQLLSVKNLQLSSGIGIEF